MKIGIYIFLTLITLTLSLRKVPIGSEGVVKHFGEVKHDKTLGEGWVLVTPFRTTVESVTRKLIKVERSAKSSSKDLQDVSTEVTVQYSIVQTSKLLQAIGNREKIESILFTPAVDESVKASTALYTAEQLITKRPKVKSEIVKNLKKFVGESLKQRSLPKDSLLISNVAITDFRFSEEFNQSIELKVKAEQAALQAKNEYEKKVTDARAEAERIRLVSTAKARAIRREAQALKENSDLVDWKKAEKWDGKLPEVTGGVIPMFDIKNR